MPKLFLMLDAVASCWVVPEALMEPLPPIDRVVISRPLTVSDSPAFAWAAAGLPKNAEVRVAEPLTVVD